MASHTVSLDEMLDFGKILAQTFLEKGTILGFQGDLGSGKTTLIRSILLAKSFDGTSITSPTYSYVHEYTKPFKVYHFDLYRLKKSDDFYTLGFDEYIDDPEAISFIEWPERILPILEKPLQLFRIEILNQESRRIVWNK